jgi:type IV pilus assembly protein PilA
MSPPGAPHDPEQAKNPRRNKTIVIVVVALAGVGLAIPCIGILAAIAIPAFIQYVKKSKTAEAEANVRQLETGLMAYCSQRGELPPAAGPLPASPGPDKQTADFSEAAGFRAVSFQPQGPLYYSYEIRAPSKGKRIVMARGDLDGDGTTSRFSKTCVLEGEQCRCADEVHIENEVE